MSAQPMRLTPETYASLVEKYDTFLFDCDGVIWRGTDVVPGVQDVLAYLRSHGKQIVFVTNNASNSRRQYKAKFDKMGIAADPEEIFGSAYASVVYLKYDLKLPAHKKVYVIGMTGLEEELASEGIPYLGGTDPAHNVLPDADNAFDWKKIKDELDPDVGAVLCGFDLRINYGKLARAHCYLTSEHHQKEGIKFVITNDDSTFPQPVGLFPGSGSLSAPLRYSTKLTPTVVGKPNPPMLECILEKKHLDPSRTIMVGDRLDTDIQFGKNGGVSTLMVLTGVNKFEDIEKQGIVPDYVVDSLGDLAVLAEKQ